MAFCRCSPEPQPVGLAHQNEAGITRPRSLGGNDLVAARGGDVCLHLIDDIGGDKAADIGDAGSLSDLIKERERAFIGLLFTLAGASYGAEQRGDIARLDELDIQLSALRIDAKTHLTTKSRSACTRALLALHQMVIAAKNKDAALVKTHKSEFMDAKDKCREAAE